MVPFEDQAKAVAFFYDVLAGLQLSWRTWLSTYLLGTVWLGWVGMAMGFYSGGPAAVFLGLITPFYPFQQTI
jgi:hypothetical protein